MRFCRSLLRVLVLCGALRMDLQAQAPVDTTGRNDLLRVFVDCDVRACDGDFFKVEITFVNLVRDRLLAQLHVLVSELSTGSGGSQYTLTFIGQGALSGMVDTLNVTTRQVDTFDERRRALATTIKRGLVRYVNATPEGARLDVTYRAPQVAGRSESRGAKDRWNFWVYSIETNGFLSGDANYKNSNLGGSLSADRVTEAWKINASVNGDYSENKYTLSDGRKLANYQHSFRSSLLIAKSLGPHWSSALTANWVSSVYSNIDRSIRLLPGVEYNVFPYAEATRRQLIARYAIGVRSLKYAEETIYGEVAETRPLHELTVATDARQKWGTISGGATWTQYLHDASKKRFQLNGGMRWRITTGLDFNFGGYYAFIRDQLNVPAGNLPDEDRLIRLRELQTGYELFGSAGLSYTFGSIFNNVVNPRFGRGGRF